MHGATVKKMNYIVCFIFVYWTCDKECFNVQRYFSVTDCLENAIHVFLISIYEQQYHIVANVYAE